VRADGRKQLDLTPEPIQGFCANVRLRANCQFRWGSVTLVPPGRATEEIGEVRLGRHMARVAMTTAMCHSVQASPAPALNAGQ